MSMGIPLGELFRLLVSQLVGQRTPVKLPNETVAYCLFIYLSSWYLYNIGSLLPFRSKMADIKNFLYAWCGKKKLTPTYDIKSAGNKNRQKFICEVS